VLGFGLFFYVGVAGFGLGVCVCVIAIAFGVGVIFKASLADISFGALAKAQASMREKNRKDKRTPKDASDWESASVSSPSPSASESSSCWIGC
jgi:hypothetical protein